VKAFLKVVPALFCLALSIESFAADIQLAWDPNPAADWIACYFTVGGSGQGWMYTSSCSQSAGASGALSGSCVFTMPGTPGTYEFNLFANNGFTLVAKSGVVAVN
jgi:hypothetical protein